MENTQDEKQEEKLLQEMIEKTGRTEQTVWLQAEFGEREKTLREHHKLTLQEVADRTGTSVSTLSRLENGSAASVSVSLLVALSDLYNVSMDFLVGRIRNPERTYYSLKSIGLSPKAGYALYKGKADRAAVNQLLENSRFQQLTHQISDFVACRDDKFSFLVEFTSNNKYKSFCDYQKTYMPERLGRYTAGLGKGCSEKDLEIIGKELKEAVREIKDRNGSNMKTLVSFSAEMLDLLRENSDVALDQENIAGNILTPEKMADRITGLLSGNGKIKGDKRRFLRCLRDALLSMELGGPEERDATERRPDK